MNSSGMNPTGSSFIDKIGLPPGALIHVGDVMQTETAVSAMSYSNRGASDLRSLTPDEFRMPDSVESVHLIIVEGLADTAGIANIGEKAGLHSLVVEDILTTRQRPKLEDYDEYLYIVAPILFPVEDNGLPDLETEQISLLLFPQTVMVFKEKSDDLFAPILRRIQSGRGRIRHMGADYLAYALVDLLVDRFFLLTERMDDAVTDIEDALLGDEEREPEPTGDIIHTISHLKTRMMRMKRHMNPVRDLSGALVRSDSPLIQEKTRLFLRDVADHATQACESMEAHREILAGLMSLHLSLVGNRMNEVMKVLTVFASIFIPLTFLAGIYGMNFEHMPELKWKWSYPALWVGFLLIPIVLVTYFRKRKWL